MGSIEDKPMYISNKIIGSYLTNRTDSVIQCAEILIESDWSIECFARINRPPC